MRSPIITLVWEQWRRTWPALVLSCAIAVIVLIWIPRWIDVSGNVTAQGFRILLGCVILLAIFACLAVQNEGGRKRGAVADRLFTLPIATAPLAAIPLFLCVLIVLIVGLSGAAYLQIHHGIPAWREPLIGAGFMGLAFSATLRARHAVGLRVLLALLLLIGVRGALELISEKYWGLLVPFELLGAYVYADHILRQDRHGGSERFGHWERTVDRLRALGMIRPWRNTPGTPHQALLWYHLRGGNQFLVPVLAASTVLMFLGLGGGIFFLAEQWMGHGAFAPYSKPVALVLIIALLGFLITFFTRCAPFLAGHTEILAGQTPRRRWEYLRPVPNSVLSTAALRSLLFQVLVWGLCISAVILVAWSVAVIADYGLAGLVSEYRRILMEGAYVRDATSFLLGMGLLLWTLSGLIVAADLTGRLWVPLALLGAVAAILLVPLGVASQVSNEPERLRMTRQIWDGIGGALITGVAASLLLAWLRKAASRTLLIIAPFCAAAAVACFAVCDESRPQETSLIVWALLALPLAPVGLIPLSIEWGRAR